MLRTTLLVLALAVAGSPAHADSVRIGDPAPAFSLASWKGAQVTLPDLRGSVVCLDFWATWCATCKAALPALDALARRAGFEDVRFLAVNIDRDREVADRYVAERLGETRLTLLRDGGATLSRYGADGMPALYLIDRDGVVRHVESGYETPALTRVERALDDLVGIRPGAGGAGPGVSAHPAQ
jgi:thiol-disulfide isomerase/thioredoxin